MLSEVKNKTIDEKKINNDTLKVSNKVKKITSIKKECSNDKKLKKTSSLEKFNSKNKLSTDIKFNSYREKSLELGDIDVLNKILRDNEKSESSFNNLEKSHKNEIRKFESDLKKLENEFKNIENKEKENKVWGVGNPKNKRPASAGVYFDKKLKNSNRNDIKLGSPEKNKPKLITEAENFKSKKGILSKTM